MRARAAPGANALRSRSPGAAIAIAAAIAALASAAIYLPHLDTGFASEDFLILARLSSKSLAATLRDELASPWLGLAPVGFWRPVSTFLLAVELELFGLHPARFHAAHLLVHALCAWLVAMLVALVLGGRRPDRKTGAAGEPALAVAEDRRAWIAVAAAATFALHPFHPSAVLFTGAFATLFGAAFSLLAILCFLIARDREAAALLSRDRRWSGLDVAALGCFALALGCYEAAAVLPFVLMVGAVLLSSPAPAARTRSAALAHAARRVAPHLAILLAYLGARRVVLGTSLGGYAAFRERFLSSPLQRAGDLAADFGRIVHPYYGPVTPALWTWVAAIAALLIAGAARSSPARRAALTGVAWIALFLAPFAFVGLVPANGRYAYLAVAALVLGICALLAPIAARWPRLGTLVAALALVAVAADWTVALRRTLAAYDQSSELVVVVRSELLGAAAEHAGGGGLLLVEDPPDVIKGAHGEPIAKVLQYGLAESVRPPFGPLERSPLPLPAALGPAARTSLRALPDVVCLRWDSYARRLMPVAPEPAPAVTLELGPFDPARGWLDATCHDCGAVRLTVLTAALPFVLEPAEIDRAEHRARFDVAGELLPVLENGDAGEVAFFWVEERGEGEAPAMSAIARFDLGSDAARSFADAAAKIRRDPRDTMKPRDDR